MEPGSIIGEYDKTIKEQIIPMTFKQFSVGKEMKYHIFSLKQE